MNARAASSRSVGAGAEALALGAAEADGADGAALPGVAADAAGEGEALGPAEVDGSGELAAPVDLVTVAAGAVLVLGDAALGDAVLGCARDTAGTAISNNTTSASPSRRVIGLGALRGWGINEAPAKAGVISGSSTASRTPSSQ